MARSPLRLIAPGVLVLMLTAIPAPAQIADHLLLSETVLISRHPVDFFGSPFIEIHNPTAASIDLSRVRITTSINTLFSVHYYYLPTGADAGGGTSGNFHAAFPGGAAIAAGDTIVVSISGSTEFEDAYGFLPDFELYEDHVQPDEVAELGEVLPGSIGAGLGSDNSNTPSFSPNLGAIMLYRWDDQADLVQDIDYLAWGINAAYRVDKSGIAVDGIDDDANPSTYLEDTEPATQISAAATGPTFGQAFRRNSAVEAGEVAGGGNGTTGHDETSEDLAASWAVVTNHAPSRPTAERFPPAPIFTTVDIAEARAGVPQAVEVYLRSYDAIVEVVLVYRVDGGLDSELALAPDEWDNWRATIPGQSAGSEIEWYICAVGAGGGRAYTPAGAPLFPGRFQVLDGPPPSPGHLLFTEVCTLPSPAEFIEICNPTDQTVDLAGFYLTDATYSPADIFYWRIAEGDPAHPTIGGGQFGDFHARFPEGARLAPGDTITIAIGGSSAFFGEFGYPPTYELYEDDAVADEIPDLREVFPGSTTWADGHLQPALTNLSECVILYHWDGLSDLVTDVDVFLWGDNLTTRFCKTGVAIDGPDSDDIATTYASETAVTHQTPYAFEHGFGDSYQRIDDEGDEIPAASNGPGGHDELSEPFPETWHTAHANPSRPDMTGVPEAGPACLLLAQNAPNPFNPSTEIVFEVPMTGTVTLNVYSLDGRLVRRLIDEPLARGLHHARWDGCDSRGRPVGSGAYVYEMRAGQAREARRMILVR